MKSYSEKLKDPRWQKLRLRVLERDNWACKKCGRVDNELHVHHLFYKINTEPWDYRITDLVTVCGECHADIEYIKKEMKLIIDMWPVSLLSSLHGLICDIRGYAEEDFFKLYDIMKDNGVLNTQLFNNGVRTPVL